MTDAAARVRERQPPGFYVLMVAQFWERGAYFALISVLVLYFIDARRLDDSEAYLLLGAFASLATLTAVAGGLAADRVFGFGRAMIGGSLLMAAGSFLLGFGPDGVVEWGLAILIVGNGLFQSNIAALLGRFYEEGDARRQPAFTYLYTVLNVGAMFGVLAMGLAVQAWGYRAAFALTGIAKLIALAAYLAGRRAMAGHDRPPDLASARPRWQAVGVLVALTLIGLCGGLLARPVLAGWILLASCIAVISAYVVLMSRQETLVRRRLIAHLVVVAAAVAFWAIYQEFASSILVFIQQDVDRTILHWLVPPSVFNALNPVFVLILTPVFLLGWRALAARNREPDDFRKFGIGIAIAGLAFMALVAGIAETPQGTRTAFLWIVAFQAVLAVGEMFVGPIGLELTAKLAPRNLAGFAMGVWYFASAAAFYLSGRLAELVSYAGKPSPSIFERGFLDYGAIGIATGILLLLAAPWLRRMTAG